MRRAPYLGIVLGIAIFGLARGETSAAASPKLVSAKASEVVLVNGPMDSGGAMGGGGVHGGGGGGFGAVGAGRPGRGGGGVSWGECCRTRRPRGVTTRPVFTPPQNPRPRRNM